jgi:acetolactate synthase I/III small subunit
MLKGSWTSGERTTGSDDPAHYHPTPRVLVALVEDRPGVLNRIVSLFRRRGLNITSLDVAPTSRPGISRLTCVVDADGLDGVLRQLSKLIEVIAVRMTHDPDAIDAEQLLQELLPREAQADGVP